MTLQQAYAALEQILAAVRCKDEIDRINDTLKLLQDVAKTEVGCSPQDFAKLVKLAQTGEWDRVHTL